MLVQHYAKRAYAVSSKFSKVSANPKSLTGVHKRMFSYAHIPPDIYQIVQYASSALCDESICCPRKGQEEYAVRLTASMRSMTRKPFNTLEPSCLYQMRCFITLGVSSPHRNIHMVTLYHVTYALPAWC